MPAARHGGFTLIELAIALAGSTLLIGSLVQLGLAANRAFGLQQDLGALQENARFALQQIAAEVEQAGFHPQPWSITTPYPAIAGGTADEVTVRGDRIVVQRWSDRNCHDNPNPVTDPSGTPLFHLLESGFQVTASGSLAWKCRFGPDSGSMTVQINNLGLVQGVESLQVLYAVDGDGDGLADHWARAGAEEVTIRGVRIGLLLAGSGRVTPRSVAEVRALDRVLAVPDDGRLRRVFEVTFAIGGRSG
jgi:hypothetical protein